MNINNLIAIVKKKIESQITLDKIEVVDKSFLHKNHPGNDKAKFHLKIYIKSQELKKLNQIESNKIIYKILNKEMKESIHSLQILIN
jgi:BolA protein